MAENHAFIDSQNMNLAITGLGWRVDYRRFRRYLLEKYGVARAFMFLGYVPKYQSLYDRLIETGFEIIFKPVIDNGHHVIKGNVDAELVLHTMIQYPNFKEAVVISGDGDFYCLLEYLLGNNKLLKLIVPDPKRYSGLLKKLGRDKIDFMTKFRDKIEYKKAP